ncbi:hypothetical protein N9X46_07185 [Paracoccaceae bacterium]|nr:hypothetical protein [Paracoccaceae bacterium]
MVDETSAPASSRAFLTSSLSPNVCMNSGFGTSIIKYIDVSSGLAAAQITFAPYSPASFSKDFAILVQVSKPFEIFTVTNMLGILFFLLKIFNRKLTKGSQNERIT